MAVCRSDNADIDFQSEDSFATKECFEQLRRYRFVVGEILGVEKNANLSGAWTVNEKITLIFGGRRLIAPNRIIIAGLKLTK